MLRSATSSYLQSGRFRQTLQVLGVALLRYSSNRLHRTRHLFETGLREVYDRKNALVAADLNDRVLPLLEEQTCAVARADRPRHRVQWQPGMPRV